MNLMRKAATTLGGIFLAVLLIAALAPKATRGIAAALVQVTNTTANPVPTVSVDDPANFPYAAVLCRGMEGFCPSNFSNSVTVPLVTTTGGLTPARTVPAPSVLYRSTAIWNRRAI